MSHKRRNGKLRWRSKRANHGKMGSISKEKGQFNRQYRRKSKGKLRLH